MFRHFALMLLMAAGCEEGPAAVAADPRDERTANVVGPEGEPAPLPASSWPTEVGSLHETIEAFESFDACLASLRARTPTEVSEVILDLSYDRFFDDVCRSIEAVHDADVEACDALSVSSSQRGCRRRLALFHGDPSACPAERAGAGREPVCIAWAARDEGLCRAASGMERMRCAAVLSNDAARCPRVRGGDRARCEAEVERYAAALGEERRTSPATRRAGVLELRLDGRQTRSDAMAHGVRVEPLGCHYTLQLGGAREAPSIGEPAETTFGVMLTIPARFELPGRLELGVTGATIEIVTPERGPIDSLVGARGQVELSAFEPRLGGAVEGTFEGELSADAEPVPVRGRFFAFVRDIDLLDDSCHAGPGL